MAHRGTDNKNQGQEENENPFGTGGTNPLYIYYI